MKELIMQGNAAIARAGSDASVKVAATYPGTPSSEILKDIAKTYPEAYAERAPNEKVALEVTRGASFTGARAFPCVKHVGLNVAAAPFMTLAYTGAKGALVILVAEGPYSHSSQNEQDIRNWTCFGKVPVLEPGDPQERHGFIREAFDLSERFDTPVFVRSETRVFHSDTVVELCVPLEQTKPAGQDKRSGRNTSWYP